MFKFIKNLFKKKGPSQEPQEGNNLEIMHKTCGNQIYYSQQDIHEGDLMIGGNGEFPYLRKTYIICPYCKEQVLVGKIQSNDYVFKM